MISTVYPPNTFGGGVGVPGDFTVTQGSPGVVEFEYQGDGFVEPSIVAAVNGVATITFTPTSGGHHRMVVRGRTASGEWTDPTSYFFIVSRA